MAITLKPATINSFNLGIHGLHDNISNVIKSKKYDTYEDAVRGIKKNNCLDALECSTCASSYDLKSHYTPPYLNDTVIYNLVKEDNIIYNKEFKTETYKNLPLFFNKFQYKRFCYKYACICFWL